MRLLTKYQEMAAEIWNSSTRKRSVFFFAIAAMLGANAAAQTVNDEGDRRQTQADNLKHPRGEKQAEMRKSGLQKLLKGQAQALGPNKVVQVAKGQFVELARQGEDKILTMLGQFADFPKNSIQQPNRAVDNTTIWAPDFSKAYYEKLLFSSTPGAVSMRNFYIEQSSNRYTVNGDVADWVSVPQTAAYYGSNSVSSSRVWRFVRDTANAWYAAQIASGKSKAQINTYLAQFDTWDRYDANGDGNFKQADHYIDHFQVVHAGEGEETGGGVLGTDAIWSHRWYAYYAANGPDGTGPAGASFGGIRIGESDYWIGDYTVEPENGGVGVFSHEFGHDLGLPDLYDTSGNSGGAENSTGFWTLYSSGSYGNSGIAAEGIGSKPIPMSAYEKLVLGWSNYQVVGYRQPASVKLGPASANTKQIQQLIVSLPDKQVVTNVGAPFAGAYQYYSGSGDNLDNSMSRQLSLPAGAMFSAKVRYSIEQDWDYAYLTVNGTPVTTNLSVDSNPYGQNFGHGITGTSGGAWVDLTADLSAYAGQTVTVALRYWTDGGVAESGLFVDQIAISGQALDDAEAVVGWTYAGFARVGSSTSKSFFNAYLAEYRNYRGYDDSMRTGPYNFGFANNATLLNWVEHYPYQDGLLVWYLDTSYPDNSIGDYCAAGRCGGLVLPVDAHPQLLQRPDNGKVWRPSFQSHDSTFGLETTDRFCLHRNSVEGCYGGLLANPLFNDMEEYWVPPNAAIGHLGWSGVKVPKTGTKIRVLSTSALDNLMQIQVN